MAHWSVTSYVEDIPEMISSLGFTNFDLTFHRMLGVLEANVSLVKWAVHPRLTFIWLYNYIRNPQPYHYWLCYCFLSGLLNTRLRARGASQGDFCSNQPWPGLMAACGYVDGYILYRSHIRKQRRKRVKCYLPHLVIFGTQISRCRWGVRLHVQIRHKWTGGDVAHTILLFCTAGCFKGVFENGCRKCTS